LSNIAVTSVPIHDLREGDVFIDVKENRAVWKALADIQVTSMDEYALRVQFIADGGISTRLWSKGSGNLHLAIQRA
jgi:hypothetical protein